MSVLITGGDSRLARAVAATLAAEGAIRLVDARFSAPLPANVEGREGDLCDPAFVAAALEGVEQVLHLAPLAPPATDDFAVLDAATRGTYVLMTGAIDAGVPKFILGSTLDLFDRLPAHWRVTEAWRPRPEPKVAHLGPWLSELCVRECCYDAAIHALCLRFGRIVDAQEAATQPYDPHWLHLEDAIEGIRCALAFAPDPRRRQGSWRIFHITAAGPRAKVGLEAAGGKAFGYRPQHDFRKRWPAGTAPSGPLSEAVTEAETSPQPVRSRPIRKVVVFGAGGPVAAATAGELAASYTLRLTDVRPIAEIAAEAQPQSPGAPLPVPLEAPHECRVVDIRNAEQVSEACAGMDAILNCTVVRPDPVDAFHVNTLGSYHVMQAAVAHGIRRVVHTGPQMVALQASVGYWWDYDVPGDAPPRPGRSLYGLSKYLGQEICRVFADAYALEVPALLFCMFVNPALEPTGRFHPFSVSWQDAARAIRRALEVRALPAPYEVMNVNGDQPHGVFSNEKAKRLLDWEPRDSLERFWVREEGGS